MVIKLTLNREKKAGFSLFEACVVMLVVSIFLAVSATVIPKRNKPKAEAEGHGRFECYYRGNQLYQQMFQGTSSLGLQAVSECRFNPPIYAKYIVVNVVGGGAGGTGGNGGEPGSFYSSFHTSARAAFVVVPGKGGSSGVDGTATSVYYEDDRTNPIVTADGGKSKRELKDARASDIKQCAITEGSSTSSSDVGGVTYTGTDIACGSIPLCEVIDNKIKVSYCFSASLYKSKLLDLQNDIILRSTDSWLRPPVLNESEATITYYDQGLIDEYNIDLAAYMQTYKNTPYYQTVKTSLATLYPTLFTMVLTFDLHRSNTVTPSLIMNYLEGMGITEGIAEYKPGQGGAPGGAGNNGAVLITW